MLLLPIHILYQNHYCPGNLITALTDINHKNPWLRSQSDPKTHPKMNGINVTDEGYFQCGMALTVEEQNDRGGVQILCPGKSTIQYMAPISACGGIDP